MKMLFDLFLTAVQVPSLAPLRIHKLSKRGEKMRKDEKR